jgi:hypothetical protein
MQAFTVLLSRLKLKTTSPRKQNSGTFGVLSTSNSSDKLAYGTATGWDFATGIGTVNAANR